MLIIITKLLFPQDQVILYLDKNNYKKRIHKVYYSKSLVKVHHSIIADWLKCIYYMTKVRDFLH